MSRFAGRRGGAQGVWDDGKNNGNGNNKGIGHRGREKGGTNNKQARGKSVRSSKEYSVYKYTIRDGLVEQIQLANHSKFLQIINRKPVLMDEIDLSEERGLILKPHLIIGNNPSIVPYQYNDLKEIEYFIDLVGRMTIDDLYFLVKSIWNDVLVTKEKELISLLATDTIVSYFQEMFITTHYVLVIGRPGWGKGVILLTFKLLGYRVVLAGDMSGANLLDLIGSIEKCQICIAEDELDDIHDDPDKERIYKMGYEDVGLITRTVDPSSSDRTIRFYNPYCIKFFASEKSPDPKELSGFNDRIFRSEVKKGKPRFLIKEIKKQMERQSENQLPKYKTIISRITFLRKASLIFKLLHNSDIVEEVTANIDGRPLELCSPALRLFNSDSMTCRDKKALQEVKNALSHFLRKKGELDKKTIQSVIYEVLNKIFNEMDRCIAEEESYDCKKEIISDVQGIEKTFYTISYDNLCHRIMEEVEGNLISQRTFESADFGKTTHDSLLAECRSVFGAKNARIRKEKDNKKALKFDRIEVNDAGKSFDIVSDIKIFDKLDDKQQTIPEDYMITSMWNEWGVETHNQVKCGTSVPISNHFPPIEQNSTSNTSEDSRESFDSIGVDQTSVHQSKDEKIVHKYQKDRQGHQSYEHKNMYWTGRRWYCRYCGLKGDKPYIESRECNGEQL